MTDHDVLRAALAERARLAPDPDGLLASTAAAARRRRARNRTVGVVGAVGVTTGAIMASAALFNVGEPVVPAPVAPAAPTSTKVAVPRPLPAPQLPFTVAAPPPGYRLDTWRLGPAESSVQYVGTASFQAVVVTLRSQDPAAGRPGKKTTVGGTPAVSRSVSPDNKDIELSWQISPGRWVSVYGRQPTVSEQLMNTVAQSVSLTPTALPSALRIANLPEGLELSSRSSSIDPGEDATFCPTGADPVTMAARCAEVRLGSGPVPDQWSTGFSKPPVGSVDNAATTIVLGPVGADGLRRSSDGRIVVHQLDGGRWISVTSPDGDAELLRQLAAAATIG